MTGKHKKGLFRYLTHWSEERKLTGLLVALMFDTVIVYPLVGVVSSNVVIQIINSLVISVIFLLALSALCRRKITRRVLGWAVVIAISLRVAHLVLRSNWLLEWEILLSLLIIGAFLVLILRYVYKEGPVTRLRLEGAIAAYLLIANGVCGSVQSDTP